MTIGRILAALRYPLRNLNVAILIAIVAIVAEAIALYAGNARVSASGPNERYDRLERLGAETTRAVGTPLDNSIALDSRMLRDPVTANWQIDHYEFSKILPAATSCTMNLYVSGLDLVGHVAGAYADVSVDGYRIRHVLFAPGSADGVRGPDLLEPIGMTSGEVRMSPNTAPLSFLFALPSRACDAARWDVAITVAGASWKIDRVGFDVEFVPVRPAVDASLLPWIALSIAVCALALYALACTLCIVARTGGAVALAVGLLVILGSPLTHDEWDSLVWPRFADLAAFGDGNPVYMWPGTPLWAVAPLLAVPILKTGYALFNDGGQGVTMTLIKLAMGTAFVANAGLAATIAGDRFRRATALLALLAPVGLFEVAGGYRETFAVTFALAALALLKRERDIAASVLFALAASISESLIALVALPAVVAFGRHASAFPRFRAAATALVAGVVTIVLQYVILTPPGFAGHAIATRVLAYRYGGASWFYVLDDLHLLPPWVGPNSIPVVIGMFAVLALPIAVAIAIALRGAPDRREPRIVFAFVGFVAATFLAYRGIDPNDWYALFAVALGSFVWFEPQSPLPLMLGALQGLAFYTIAGVSDFVDWRYFEPVNRGLFGTLGRPVTISVAIVNALVLALYAASVTGNSRWLFGRSSPLFAGLLVASLAASASQGEVSDAVICGVAAGVVLGAYRAILARRPPGSWERNGIVVPVLATLTAIVGLLLAAGDPVAIGVTAVAFLLALTRGMAVMDVLMTLGGVALLVSEPRAGWVSDVGLAAIAAIVVVPVGTLYRILGLQRGAPLVPEADGPTDNILSEPLSSRPVDTALR